MLEIDLTTQHGDFDLFVSESLPLPDITALFGVSGAGKSTLLSALMGLQRSRGTIRFNGDCWLDSARGIDVPAHKRTVSIVFQDGRLFEHLGVEGNLRFAQRRARSAAPDIDQVCSALDIQELRARRITALSGGERQRVAVARTLLTGAKLLLLDEPLSGLDNARKAEVIRYVRALPQQFGVKLMFVSHSVAEVARLATDMVVLDAGRVRMVGATSDVLERLDLQDITGRRELGVVLSAEVAEVDEAAYVTRFQIGAQQLAAPDMSGLLKGQRVPLHVPARDVVLGARPPEGLSIRNVLHGHVLEIVFSDGSAMVDVLVDVEGQHVRARVTRDAVQELGLASGEAVYVLIKSVTLADNA